MADLYHGSGLARRQASTILVHHMNETPDLEITLNRRRRRLRLLAAIGLGGLAAGIFWVVVIAIDSARNPCKRARDYLCAKEPGSLTCQGYEQLLADSESDPSRAVRGEIRHQCLTKIERLKKDDGIEVP
jgi:hypothetical protein